MKDPYKIDPNSISRETISVFLELNSATEKRIQAITARDKARRARGESAPDASDVPNLSNLGIANKEKKNRKTEKLLKKVTKNIKPASEKESDEAAEAHGDTNESLSFKSYLSEVKKGTARLKTATAKLGKERLGAGEKMALKKRYAKKPGRLEQDADIHGSDYVGSQVYDSKNDVTKEGRRRLMRVGHSKIKASGGILDTDFGDPHFKKERENEKSGDKRNTGVKVKASLGTREGEWRMKRKREMHEATDDMGRTLQGNPAAKAGRGAPGWKEGGTVPKGKFKVKKATKPKPVPRLKVPRTRGPVHGPGGTGKPTTEGLGSELSKYAKTKDSGSLYGKETTVYNIPKGVKLSPRAKQKRLDSTGRNLEKRDSDTATRSDDYYGAQLRAQAYRSRRAKHLASRGVKKNEVVADGVQRLKRVEASLGKQHSKALDAAYDWSVPGESPGNRDVRLSGANKKVSALQKKRVDNAARLGRKQGEGAGRPFLRKIKALNNGKQ